MVRPRINSREAARRKAQKRLEGIDFTPQTAKFLSELLIVLVERGESRRSEVLSEFARCANQKLTWDVPPRRL